MIYPPHGRKSICTVFLVLVLLVPLFSQPQEKEKLFLVCGDSQVLLVDYPRSRDTIPEIIWTWDAHSAKDLPDEYRLQKFNSLDDCKAVGGGKKILVSSSSGAVALLRQKNSKVIFYASVPNAHSIELLPGNRLVAAASTATDGNQIILFKIRLPEIPLFTDSLYSAHGLVWHRKRKSLFALGYDVLREYKLVKHHDLKMIHAWKIPGIGGHDLQLAPDGRNLFITEHNGVWLFDMRSFDFRKIQGFPDTANIKSVGQDKSGQYIFTVPEESWWTYHVSFSNPARRLAFPGMKVYKARWARR